MATASRMNFKPMPGKPGVEPMPTRPTSPAGFEPGYRPMGANNPFAGLVAPDETPPVVSRPGGGGMPPVARSVPSFEAAPSGGSRIPQSPMNRGYARDARTQDQGGAPSQFDRLQEGGFGDGGLANAPARPVGRDLKNNPERRIEMAERSAMADGDYKSAAQMAGARRGFQQQEQGMDFARERDQSGREHDVTMYDLHQQAQQANEGQRRQQHLEDWTRSQEAEQQRDAARRTHDMTMFGLSQGQRALEQEREQNLREQERTRTPQVGTIQVPGTDYVIPTADGRAMGTLPVRPDGPLPEGMVPMQAERNGVHYGKPSVRKPTVPTVKEFKSPDGTTTEYREFNPATGKWRKVAFEDENGDGIDDRQQQGGAGEPTQAPLSQWQSKVQSLMGGK